MTDVKIKYGESKADIKRAARYERIYKQLEGLIKDKSPGLIPAMSTISAVLHHKLTHHFWTGFYFFKEDETLEVGPYQGPVACQILKERGVCLKSAKSKEAVFIEDVHAIPDHIACDARSQSEIVIPLIKDDKVIAVLDIDSDKKAQFDEHDITPLQKIVNLLLPFV